MESLYTKFSEKSITAKLEIEPNRSNGIEVFESTDKYEKQLIYSFIMLNVWRSGIFHFEHTRSVRVLEAIRQSLFQILGTDEESTKTNLTERDITPFYPIFIGLYKTQDPSKPQIENELSTTKSFTYSSEKLNYFQFGLYTGSLVDRRNFSAPLHNAVKYVCQEKS